VFTAQSIERCQSIHYNPDNIIEDSKKSMGIDPSFGSSKFGIVVTQFVNERIEVIHGEEYDRPDFSGMINEVWRLKQRCGNISNIYVDAANPEIWQSLKREFNEPYSEQYMSDKIAWVKNNNLNIAEYMIVVPTPFSTKGAEMLQHAKSLLEDPDGLVAIHKDRFTKLIIALRTAVANEYKLDKEQTSYHDILDAFRLSLQFYNRSR
jgi:hypothetical protein